MHSDPREALKNAIKIASTNESREESLEARVVKRILNRAGLSATAMGRSRDLSIRRFLAEYPRFPARLFTAAIRFTAGSRIGWTDLFGSGFNKLPWVRELHEQVAAANVDLEHDSVALVFNAPHTRGGTLLVVHSLAASSVQMLADTDTTCIVRSYGGVVLVTEQLDAFLARIGSDWVH